MAFPYTLVTTSPYSVASTDAVYYVDCSSSNIVLNLPAITSGNDGVEVRVRRVDATAGRTLTIQAAAGEYIDAGTSVSAHVWREDQATRTFKAAYSSSGGSRWRVLDYVVSQEVPLSENDTTGATNGAVLREYVARAIAVGVTLRLPSGVFKVDCPTTSGQDYSIDVNGDLAMVGHGTMETTLEFVDPGVTTAYMGFRVQGGVRISLQGVRFVGWDPNKSTAGVGVAFATMYIWRLGYSTPEQSTSFHAVQCEFSGSGGIYSVYTGPSTGTTRHDVTVESCVFDTTQYNILMQETSGAASADCALSARGCTFAVTPYSGTDANATLLHCLYLAYGVTTNLTDCRFTAASGKAIKYGGAGVFGGVAKFVSLTGCRFDEACEIGLLTNAHTTSHITNCVFRCANVGIYLNQEANGTVMLTSCSFLNNDRSISEDSSVSASSGSLHAVNCRFVADGSMSSGPAMLVRAANTASGHLWRFTSCVFDNGYTGSGTNFIHGINGPSPTEIHTEFYSCTFVMPNSSYNGAMLKFTGGRTVVRGCEIDTNIGIEIAVGAIAADVRIAESRIVTSNSTFGYAIQVTASATAIAVIEGHSNTFVYPASVGYASVAAGSAKGYLVPPSSTHSGVVAASTVGVRPDRELYPLSGAATIDNIQIAGSRALDLFRGPIRFHHTVSGISFSAAGNIRPKSTAARAMDTVSSFIYDSAAARWLEV